MKTSWDKLMRYAPEREYPLAPLQLDEAARIVEQTMQKAGIKTKKTARPIRAAALAAAIVDGGIPVFAAGLVEFLHEVLQVVELALPLIQPLA